MELFLILVKVGLALGVVDTVAPEGSMVDTVASSAAEIVAPAAVGAGAGSVAGLAWLGGASSMSVAGTAWSSSAVVGTAATTGAVVGASAGLLK